MKVGTMRGRGRELRRKKRHEDRENSSSPLAMMDGVKCLPRTAACWRKITQKDSNSLGSTAGEAPSLGLED